MKKHGLILLSGFFVSTALAHSPFLECQFVQEKQIQCVGSFSDGSSTFGVRTAVYDYSDEILFEGKLDKQNTIIFDQPDEEEYYIKFDADAGHIFELDYLDVETKAKKEADTDTGVKESQTPKESAKKNTSVEESQTPKESAKKDTSVEESQTPKESANTDTSVEESQTHKEPVNTDTSVEESQTPKESAKKDTNVKKSQTSKEPAKKDTNHQQSDFKS